MTIKGEEVDAISGTTGGSTRITKLSEITSFVIDPSDRNDVMINGDFYKKGSLKYCNFYNELRKVVLS